MPAMCNLLAAMPTTRFVRPARSILQRSAGFAVVGRDRLTMTVVSVCCCTLAQLHSRGAVPQAPEWPPGNP